MCLAILPYLFVGMVTFSLDCLGDTKGNELHHPVVESSQQESSTWNFFFERFR